MGGTPKRGDGAPEAGAWQRSLKGRHWGAGFVGALAQVPAMATTGKSALRPAGVG